MNESGNQASICAETVPFGPRVYFIHDPKAKRIKIGFSNNVPDRLSGLQTGHHSTLVLLGTIPDEVNPGLTELDLHRRFDHLRVRGEWFKATPELMQFIEESCQNAKPAPINWSAQADWWCKRIRKLSGPRQIAGVQVGYAMRRLAMSGETPELKIELMKATAAFAHASA